jgi:hypothetical protein
MNRYLLTTLLQLVVVLHSSFRLNSKYPYPPSFISTPCYFVHPSSFSSSQPIFVACLSSDPSRLKIELPKCVTAADAVKHIKALSALSLGKSPLKQDIMGVILNLKIAVATFAVVTELDLTAKDEVKEFVEKKLPSAALCERDENQQRTNETNAKGRGRGFLADVGPSIKS